MRVNWSSLLLRFCFYLLQCRDPLTSACIGKFFRLSLVAATLMLMVDFSPLASVLVEKQNAYICY